MKKPFKQTKFGKLITSDVVKGIITKIPFVGSVAGELLNRNTAMEGSMTKEQLIHHAIKLVIYAGLLYFGIISFDQFSGA